MKKGRVRLSVQQSKVTRRLGKVRAIDLWVDGYNEANVERVDGSVSTLQIRKAKPDE
jgi:hypothetical protein